MGTCKAHQAQRREVVSRNTKKRGQPPESYSSRNKKLSYHTRTTRRTVSVEILSITAHLYEQVAQLSLTNARDALHHDKWLKF